MSVEDNSEGVGSNVSGRTTVKERSPAAGTGACCFDRRSYRQDDAAIRVDRRQSLHSLADELSASFIICVVPEFK